MVAIDSSKYQKPSGRASLISIVSEMQPLFANEGLAAHYQFRFDFQSIVLAKDAPPSVAQSSGTRGILCLALPG